MGKKKLAEKIDEVTTPEAVTVTVAVAEVPAEQTTPEAVTVTGEPGKRGRGRPKNAERGQIECTREDDNTLTVNVAGLKVTYTPAGKYPQCFIKDARVIGPEDARRMYNVLTRLPVNGLDKDAFIAGLKSVGNLELSALVVAYNWHRDNVA